MTTVGSVNDALTVISTGSYGLVGSSVSGYNAVANATTSMTIGTATYLLTAGYADNDYTRETVLAEYNADGSLNASFGSSGFVLTELDGKSGANAITLMDNSGGTPQFILVAGYGPDPIHSGQQDIMLAEYNLDGSINTSFGTGGSVFTAVGSQAAANAVTLVGSGTNTYIFVTGYGTAGGQQVMTLAKYNSTGGLVSTFGTGGIVTTAIGSTAEGNAILISGSSVWVAGSGNWGPTAVLVQYSTSGAFDQLVASALPGNAAWNAMTLSDGNILVAGVSNGTMALAEYNTYGYVGTSFGADGVVLTNIGGNATANAIMVETGGKILVSGCGTYSGNGKQEFIVAQYSSNGSLDPTFGVDGVAMPMVASGATLSSEAYAEAMLPSGAIVVAGQIEDPGGGHEDIFVAEYTTATSPSTIYAYDVRNKMVGFSGATGTATYLYDDDGNRVQETTGGTTSFYLTDTTNPTGYAQPIEVWTSTNGSLSSATLNTTYLIGDRIFGQDVAGTLSYLLVDGHGSTDQRTNATGTVSVVLSYNAFGDALNFNPATASTVFLFGGDAIYDPVSGIYFNGDGIRDRIAGSPDLIEMDDQGNGANSEPATLNLEIYGDGDPVNNSDPSGHYSITFSGKRWASCVENLPGGRCACNAIGRIL